MGEKSIYIRDRDEYSQMKINDIIWIQSNGGACKIYTTLKRYVVKVPLEDILEKLPIYQFVRIHIHLYVNVEHLLSIDIANDKVLLEKASLPLEKKYKEKLIKRLNLI